MPYLRPTSKYAGNALLRSRADIRSTFCREQSEYYGRHYIQALLTLPPIVIFNTHARRRLKPRTRPVPSQREARPHHGKKAHSTAPAATLTHPPCCRFRLSPPERYPRTMTKPAVVIDTGSDRCKVGLASAAVPLAVFPICHRWFATAAAWQGHGLGRDGTPVAPRLC